MTDVSPEEIGRRMDALGLWDAIMPYNWGVKPLGTAFPYFCTALAGDGKPVKTRFLMIEGWQTLHDFVRTRVDPSFGFYSTPAEMPHFETVVLATGETFLFRHDPGYVPRSLTEAERGLCRRIMWEAYGVMMRIESDRELPVRFSGDRAMFARVEDSPGSWSDKPLPIPDARPYMEKISFPTQLVAKAKDLPFAQKDALELDFRLMPTVATRDPRPRSAYQLAAVDSATGAVVFSDRTSVSPDFPLKSLWEKMPARALAHIVGTGRVPGEIKVASGRVFRMLRPLCVELPFKLSLHDSLPRLESAFKV